MMDATWASGRGCAVAISMPGPWSCSMIQPILIDGANTRRPARMVAEVQRQLKLIHGLEKIPDAYAAAFQYWGDDPYGGATNRWLPGVQAWVAAEHDSTPCPHSCAIRGSALCLW